MCSFQLKETSDYLRSNLLSELAQQISLSTERTMADFDNTKTSLEKLHSKLVQIEGEKDRERRLTKQREWVRNLWYLVEKKRISLILFLILGEW